MNSRSIIIRIVAVALLLYSLASLMTVHRQLDAMQCLRGRLTAELEALQQERRTLEEQMAAYGEDAEMRRLAWERLGMVAPGETVYFFNGGTD
ncbi:MAG: septum formation initiator family protein [Oscillospiraceae bacterium]|nr:septum formation initiator family protein [Oscillospiraceae bacterium]